MKPAFEAHYTAAKALLDQLATSDGLLASSVAADNYKRIWARDAVVCGLAGLLEQQAPVIEGLKRSLTLLAKHQHPLGMIPSNVDPADGSVSYGSLVGRVDTNTWFIIGCCLYYHNSQDSAFWERCLPAIERARDYLRTITFNDRGWIYTPLSGNWADEYPVHGYTLYDNALRLWGEQLYTRLTGTENPTLDHEMQRMLYNFWPSGPADHDLVYQRSGYAEALLANPGHFISFILPGVYDTRFDAAANAVSLCLYQLDPDRRAALRSYTDRLEATLGAMLVPAYWPPIDESSPDWSLLQHNYSYDFKNHPGSFHNGGIWPVWMGLFCLGLSFNQLRDQADRIVAAYTDQLDPDSAFTEYYQANELKPAGKTQMGYTASGVIFMKHALTSNPSDIRQILGL